jgi:ANTAR domain
VGASTAGDEPGETTGVVRGLIADLTMDEKRASSAAVRDARQYQAVIQQAQGVLMAVYQLGPHAAISLLKWHSMNGNVRISVLADRVMAAMATGAVPPTRRALDRLLAEPEPATQSA